MSKHVFKGSIFPFFVAALGGSLQVFAIFHSFKSGDSVAALALILIGIVWWLPMCFGIVFMFSNWIIVSDEKICVRGLFGRHYEFIPSQTSVKVRRMSFLLQQGSKTAICRKDAFNAKSWDLALKSILLQGGVKLIE